MAATLSKVLELRGIWVPMREGEGAPGKTAASCDARTKLSRAEAASGARPGRRLPRRLVKPAETLIFVCIQREVWGSCRDVGEAAVHLRKRDNSLDFFRRSLKPADPVGGRGERKREKGRLATCVEDARLIDVL